MDDGEVESPCLSLNELVISLRVIQCKVYNFFPQHVFKGGPIPTILVLLMCLLSKAVSMIEEKPLVILITSYNNIRWVENNLRSVAMQKYSNYRVIFIDDCSIDDTAEKAKALIANSSLENRTTFISNPTRIGALENIYNGVYLCKDDEIDCISNILIC